MKRILLTVFALIAGFAFIPAAHGAIDYCEEFFQHGEYEQAIDACTNQIQKTGPKEKLAHDYYYRGRAYEKKGAQDRAIADLKKAIALNNGFYLADISLGMLYYHLDDLDNAIAHYTRAITLRPESQYRCVIYTNRGNAYSSKGNFDQAIADYATCIESNPDTETLANALTMRGSAYLSKSDYDRSLSDSNKAIELNPTLFPAYNLRGLAHYSKGRYEEAVDDFNVAIELQPAGVNLFAVYANRANARKAQHRLKQAISDYTKSLELNPNVPNVFYNLACTYALAKRTSDACKALQKAVEHGYDNWAMIKNDQELASLRGSACYKAITTGK